jgi:hypothetical protein
VETQIVAIVVTSIFSAGASWAVLNYRVKALEDKQEKHDDHAERLIRLETKLDILIQQIKRTSL